MFGGMLHVFEYGSARLHVVCCVKGGPGGGITLSPTFGPGHTRPLVYMCFILCRVL